MRLARVRSKKLLVPVACVLLLTMMLAVRPRPESFQKFRLHSSKTATRSVRLRRPLPIAHIINVPGATGAKRREHVVSEFQRAGYPYEFFSAEKPVHANGTERLQGANGLTLGEISLAQAHSRLYQNLIASKEEIMLIGEDDVALCDEFSDEIESVLERLPPDFDAVKLEYGKTLPRWRIFNMGSRIVRGMGGCCTGLYIVSNAGASLFLTENPPEDPVETSDGVIDQSHIYSRNAKLFHTVPPLAWQDKSDFVQSSGSHRELGSN